MRDAPWPALGASPSHNLDWSSDTGLQSLTTNILQISVLAKLVRPLPHGPVREYLFLW